MNRSVKLVIRTITSVLVFVVVFLALSVSIIRFFGFEVYGVLTGSMEPEYPTGSLIYVKKIDTSALQVGDTISFKLSENIIATHRIVELVPDESNPSVIQYRTKGDANDVADASLVSREDIIGKVVFCLPKMGYFLNYIQSPTGITTTVLVSLLLIALVFVSELITADGSSKLIWKLRGMITGDHRSPQQLRRTQQPHPRYEAAYGDYHGDRRRSQPARREASQRSYREADYYESARSRSRYSEDYDRPRRSTRYEDEGYTRSSQSYSRSRYGDSRSRYDSRYEDGYSPRASRSQSAYQPSQRSRHEDDHYDAPRRSAGTQSRSAARRSDGYARSHSSAYTNGSSARSAYASRGSHAEQRSSTGRRSRYEDD